ncbi:hypothetical protein [Archangium primigenium]|uniref:hypothetical protein n=1 Tax=[Archangium] primigenium TaxID=2792470 RepID=UPI0019560107|nr:hypothetical protein [Archangium primigenium]MBM7112564.1 hypothetical protein [Archangium primigenium]
MSSTTNTARACIGLMLLLSACVTPPGPAPSRVEELTRHVLFIDTRPSGERTAQWKRAEDIDLSPYQRPTPRVVLTRSGQRDCDEENRACIRECMSRPLPPGYGHITSGGRGRGGKEVYCNEQCMPAYRDCTKLQELQAREFTTADSAVAWLKQHGDVVRVGGVIIVAGVAFVVVSASAGALLLVPAVLLAAPTAVPEPLMAKETP